MPSSLAPAFGFFCFHVEAKLKYLIPATPFKSACLPYYHPAIDTFWNCLRSKSTIPAFQMENWKAHLAGDKSGKPSTHKWNLTEPYKEKLIL